MKVLIHFNIFITYVLVFARSPIGQVFLIILFTIVDGFTNMLSIAMLLVDRISVFVEDPVEAQEKAQGFAIIASVALGVGICMFNLITEVDEDDRIRSHRASIVLSVMSFMITLVGFMLVIVPPGTTTMAWSILLLIKMVFAVLLAAVSPYIVWNASRNLALTYSGTFDGFMDSMIEKTHIKMTEQLDTALVKKQRQPRLRVSADRKIENYKFNEAI